MRGWQGWKERACISSIFFPVSLCFFGFAFWILLTSLDHGMAASPASESSRCDCSGPPGPLNKGVTLSNQNSPIENDGHQRRRAFWAFPKFGDVFYCFWVFELTIRPGDLPLCCRLVLCCWWTWWCPWHWKGRMSAFEMLPWPASRWRQSQTELLSK